MGDVMSISDVAAELRMAKATVYELVQRNSITSYRFGRSIRIRRSDFDAFVKRSVNSSAAPADAELAGSAR